MPLSGPIFPQLQNESLRNKKGCPLQPLKFSIGSETRSGKLSKEKKKGTKIGKEVNLSLSADDKVSYVDKKVSHTTVKTKNKQTNKPVDFNTKQKHKNHFYFCTLRMTI